MMVEIVPINSFIIHQENQKIEREKQISKKSKTVSFAEALNTAMSNKKR